MAIFEREKIQWLLPFGGAFLILLGIMKMNVFYSAFNININEYIDTTEYLTAFLGDSLSYVIMLLLGFSVDFNNSEEREGIRKRNEMLLIEPKFSKRFILFFKSIGLFFIIVDVGTLLAITFANRNLFSSRELYWLLFYINGLFLLMFFLSEFKRQHYITYGKKMEPSYFNLLLIAVFLAFLVFANTNMDVARVKDSKKYLYTSFTLNNTLVQSDSLHYYIGHTRGFLFFHCQDSTKTYVFPMSRVTELSFKPNNH